MFNTIGSERSLGSILPEIHRQYRLAMFGNGFLLNFELGVPGFHTLPPVPDGITAWAFGGWTPWRCAVDTIVGSRVSRSGFRVGRNTAVVSGTSKHKFHSFPSTELAPLFFHDLFAPFPTLYPRRGFLTVLGPNYQVFPPWIPAPETP